MNLDKFGNVRSFEDLEYTNIFIAGMNGSKAFYATKGYETREDGIDFPVIVCLGPLSHISREVSGPCIYNPSVLSDYPVLDMNEHIHLFPSMNIKDVKKIENDPRPGDLVCLQDKYMLALDRTEARMGQQYLDLQTGQIISEPRKRYGFIISNWKLQTTDTEKPEIVLSYPDINIDN